MNIAPENRLSGYEPTRSLHEGVFKRFRQNSALENKVVTPVNFLLCCQIFVHIKILAFFADDKKNVFVNFAFLLIVVATIRMYYRSLQCRNTIV